MTLLELARNIGTDTDIFVRLRQYKALTLEVSTEFDRGISVKFDMSLIPKTDTSVIGTAKAIHRMSILEHLELFCQSVLWGDGPKVFRPTAEQLFALEQMNLNVEVQDFNLPFGMIAVELPEAYRITKKDDEGEVPHASLLYKDPSINFFVHDLLYPFTALKAYWRGQPEEAMEEWLTLSYTDRRPQGMLETSQEEFTVEAQVRRAVLNYILLLDEVGIKKQGSASPNQYSQLVKWCAKTNKHTAKNKRRLSALPTVYGLERAPTPLVRYVKSEAELPGEQPGWKVKPHCRRGHYRNQPTKAGLKRIRIAPVFVNAHLMNGPQGGTYAT